MPDISLTPALTKLVNKALGPLAEAMGENWKAAYEERVAEKRRRRQQRNIAAHLTALTYPLNSASETSFQADGSVFPAELTEEQEELLHSWVDGAQDVSAGDKDLAAMWQELLRKIATSTPFEIDPFPILRRLTPAMASLLLRYNKKRAWWKRPRLEDYQVAALKTLRSLHLLENDWIRFLALAACAGCAVYCLFQFTSISLSRAGVMPGHIIEAISYQVFIVLIVSFLGISFRKISRRPLYQISWLGKRFLEVVNRPSSSGWPPEATR